MKNIFLIILLIASINTRALVAISSISDKNTVLNKAPIGVNLDLQVLKSKEDDTHIFAITDQNKDPVIISSFSIDFANKQSWAFDNNFECKLDGEVVLAFFYKAEVKDKENFRAIEAYKIDASRSIFQRLNNEQVQCRWSPKDSSPFPKVWTVK